MPTFDGDTQLVCSIPSGHWLSFHFRVGLVVVVTLLIAHTPVMVWRLCVIDRLELKRDQTSTRTSYVNVRRVDIGTPSS